MMGEKFKCQIQKCGKEYSSRNELNNHILNLHGYFKCKHCNKEYPGVQQLNRHVKKDHKLEMFKCESCNKSYSKAYMLNSSICKQCDYKKHYVEIVHEGKPKLKCNLCDHHYTQFHNLKNHIAIAHKIKMDRIFAYSKRQRTPRKL